MNSWNTPAAGRKGQIRSSHAIRESSREIRERGRTGPGGDTFKSGPAAASKAPWKVGPGEHAVAGSAGGSEEWDPPCLTGYGVGPPPQPGSTAATSATTSATTWTPAGNARRAGFRLLRGFRLLWPDEGTAEGAVRKLAIRQRKRREVQAAGCFTWNPGPHGH